MNKITMYKCPICGYISDKDYDVCPACNNGNCITDLGKSDNIQYIDLGLSVLWADRNVGADKPEDYGEYYIFDEAQKLTFTVPTKEQWDELVKKCTWIWTTQNGVNGRLVTGPNNNSIFLPAAGYRYDTYFGNAGSGGDYWSSSIHTGRRATRWSVYFSSNTVQRTYDYRFSRLSVRAVSK